MDKTKVELLVPCKVIASPQVPFKTVAGTFVPTAQPDLLYMKSVFVSTGSNLNDDVFLPEETWKARATPALKPVDWEHNTGRELTKEEQKENPGKVVVDNQTIGVMYNAYVTDNDNMVISEDKISATDFEIPSQFHIVDESVIWKALFPTVAARIEKGAEEETLFVSMEAWFGDYDYLVGSKIIARNEDTAFLDDSLKANGGNGSFGSSTVKRILRNITFGGKGIVERPANEPSVIQSVTHTPLGVGEATIKAIANNIIGDLENSSQTVNESRKDSTMSDNKNVDIGAGVPLDKYTAVTEEAVTLRAEVKTAVGERDVAVAEKVELQTQVENITSAFVNGAQTLDEVLPGVGVKLAKAKAEEFFGILTEAIATSNTNTDELKKQLAEVNEKLAAQAVEAKNRDRLVEINKVLSLLLRDDNVEEIETKANKMLVSSDKMDDEVFASYLEDYKETVALAAKAPPFKKKGDDEEDEDDKKKKKKSKGSDGETDVTILDGIIASEGAPSAGDNPKPMDFENAYAGLVNTMLTAVKPASQRDDN